MLPVANFAAARVRCCLSAKLGEGKRAKPDFAMIHSSSPQSTEPLVTATTHALLGLEQQTKLSVAFKHLFPLFLVHKPITELPSPFSPI
jgi:hypothetical protein